MPPIAGEGIRPGRIRPEGIGPSGLGIYIGERGDIKKGKKWFAVRDQKTNCIPNLIWLFTDNMLPLLPTQNKSMSPGQLMSVTEYATSRGVSRQYILKCIKDSKQLPGISHYFKTGATYVLVVA